ncbi:MAG: hypothetical protein ABSG88_19590, partial [Bradyrhizobium sp.]
GGFAVFDPAKEGYYDFRVKGCSPSKEQGNDKAASDAAKSVLSPPQNDQACADNKSSCMSGCSQNYQMTSDNYHNCMQFCSSPCSNGTVREANPYLKSGSANGNQGRKFSKDECRDDACANADFGVTGMDGRQSQAAKAICDQQYLQCLKDGQAKPNPQEAVRIARSQVPDEPPPQPAQQQQPARSYRAQMRGDLVDCFFDPDYKQKGGVPVCLSPRQISGGDDAVDTVNGTQAYILNRSSADLYYRRKAQYGGGRSW